MTSKKYIPITELPKDTSIKVSQLYALCEEVKSNIYRPVQVGDKLTFKQCNDILRCGSVIYYEYCDTVSYKRMSNGKWKDSGTGYEHVYLPFDGRTMIVKELGCYDKHMIAATGNHKVYTTNRGWIKTKDLEQGDNVIAENKIGENDLGVIAKAVRLHYGPFTENNNVKFSLSWPFDTVVMQVHNVDFHNTMNTMYFTRGKIEHK
jgi:hypothetical protein